MNILIIGSGSYVLGDQYGPGVVLRSVVQWLADEIPDTSAAHQVWLSFDNPGTKEKKQAEIMSILDDLGVPDTLVNVTLLSSLEARAILEKQDPDACFIAVPDQLHADYAIQAMQAGVPVWIVKPLTGNWPEAQKLAAITKDTGSKVWVDYHKRFDTSNRLLKHQVKQAELGRMLAYSVDYHQPRDLPIDVFSWTVDVDVFTYIGCHYVDQIFFLYPEAVLTSVDATPLRGTVFQETGQHDGVLANLAFQTSNGPLHCPMNIGWFNPLGSPAKSLQTLKAQFETGLVELDQTRRGVQVWSDKGVAEVNPYFFCETSDILGRRRFTGYGYDSVKHFLDLVQTGVDWPESNELPTLSEAVKTEYVLSVVQQSLKSSSKIVLKADRSS